MSKPRNPNPRKFLKRAYSSDALRSFTPNKDAATVVPNFSFQAVIQMIDEDPVSRGTLTHFVDKCMEGDYALIKKDSSDYDRSFEMSLDEDYMFRHKILRTGFLVTKLFNNSFIEIVRDVKGHTKSLNVLDSMNIEPVTAPNGDPIRYRSKVSHPETGKFPIWEKNEIVWIKYGDRSTGYAPVDLKALWETLWAKRYVVRYLSWLWKTGQYRSNFSFKGSNSNDIPDFLSFIRRHDEDFSSPFIQKGEVEHKILRDMKENDSARNLLTYYDNQIVINLRVPPIDVGIPDSSGRSNSDAQSNNFVTHVKGFKQVIEDSINYDLFPKINKGNNLLKFAPVDRFEEKMVLENIQIMKSLGMTDEAVKEYLQDHGMFFLTKKLFNEPEESEIDNPRDLDTMPSRTGKGVGEANEQQSEPTTRSDQLRKE